MVDPDQSLTDRIDLTRRNVLRSAAGAAGLPLVSGTGSAQEAPIRDGPVPLECADEEAAARQFGFASGVSREPTHEIGENFVVELESEVDGEVIQFAVCLPKLEEGETVPVVLRSTPYVADLGDSDCDHSSFLIDEYVPQGYAVATHAVRGTGGSGGCMELFGATEQADVDQAVTWLGQQDWSNGNVGMYGVSYDGTTPWMVARWGNPHLATIVPISGVPDIHGLMYKRGAPEQRGYLILPWLYYGLYSFGLYNPATGTDTETYLTRATCPDNYAQGTVWSAYAGATGEYDPSGYWTERVLKPGVARNFEGSILLVQGLQDWNVNPSQVYPWKDVLQAAGIDVQLYFGQWGHSSPTRDGWADHLLRWFDRYLKDRDVDVGEPVYVEDSAGEWRTEESWPPERAERTSLYFGVDGDLRTSPSEETGSAVVHVNPAGTTSPDCDACATFETGPFEEEFRFAGIPDVHVTATPTGPGGHLSAFLYAVDDEGGAERLGWGQVDLRFAQDRPSGETVVPGEPLDVHIPLEPLDVVVPEGQRLVAVITQETHSDREYSPTPTPVEVETGGDNHVTLQSWGADLADTDEAVALGGERAMDASVYFGGQTSHQAVTVRTPQGGLVRDVVPAEWNVLEAGDVHRVEEGDGVQYVEFRPAAPAGERTFEYFLEAPDDPAATDSYAFGPAEIKRGDGWEQIEGTDGEAIVAGVST